MSEERTNVGNPPGDDLDLRDDFDEPEVDELDDGGQLGGETEEEPPEEADEETEQRPQRRARPGPRERRHAAELRELREETKRIREELAQTRQAYQQPVPRADPYEQARREQAEREQVSLLAPEQQIAYYSQRTEQRVATVLQQQQNQIKDQIDRSSWDALCRTDPLAAKLRDRVDAMAAGLAPGSVPRELIYEKILGEEIRKRRSTELPRQKRAAAERVRQQTAAPAGGRSDGGRSRADARDNSIEAARRRIKAGGALW